MGVTPSQFWDLTHWEFVVIARGAKKRVDREMRKAAWVVAHVGNFLGVKPKMTIDRLLKRRGPINNDALAAMIPTKEELERGGLGAPKSRAGESAAIKAEQERAKQAFVEMMRVKAAEAKVAYRKKQEAERARKAAKT